jgi:plasmid stabilization system protein ParE
MTRLEFRPQAEAEIDEAATWYEEQAPGLGTTFLTAVDRALQSILERPLAFSRVAHQTRRLPIHSFPYSIIYQPRGDIVLVISCFHGRRHPKRWQERL